MKQILSVVLLALLALSPLLAQEVLPKQQSLITKISATWCPNCGTWGWRALDQLIEENQDHAVIISAHASGDLGTIAGQDFKKNLNSVGQPLFYLNNEHTRLGSTNGTTKRKEIQETVLAATETPPIANTGVYYFAVSNRLSIDIKTKFFQTTPGAYSLGTYLIENKVSNYQAGANEVLEHKKILRLELSDNSFGIPLENAIADTESDVQYNFTIPNGWNRNELEIVTIIWKKEGSKYLFVNANMTPVSGTTNRPPTPSTPEEEVDTEEEVVVSPEMEEPDTEQEAQTDPEENEDMEAEISPEMPPTGGNTLDFSKYPWLNGVTDIENCSTNQIVVYNSSIYQYLFVSDEEGGTLYFQDGTYYCSDAASLDCRNAYNLMEANIDAAWSCGDNSVAMEEETADTMEIDSDTTNSPNDTEETSTDRTTDFIDYPWLIDLVDTIDCCTNQTVTAYASGIYTFIYIAADSDCSEVYGQLYFQDGTFYCGDGPRMDCRSAYSLSEIDATVLWTCGMGN